MGRYFDMAGRPMTMDAWARAFEKPDRVLARTACVAGGEVSTVWLGLDHQFGDGPPMIFETLVFGGPLADEMERYSTKAEALAGHAAMVAKLGGAR